MIRKPHFKTVTIADGATKSAAFEIRDYVLTGIIIPANMENTELTFEVCDTLAGTYVPLYRSDGTQVAITYTTAARGFGLSTGDLDALAPWWFVKLVSAGSNQTGDADIVLALK
jgi:hypothetical protein